MSKNKRPIRDGKDRFYRTLKLDKETTKIIREFREFRQAVLQDREEQYVRDNLRRQDEISRWRPNEQPLERNPEQKDSTDSNQDNKS